MQCPDESMWQLQLATPTAGPTSCNVALTKALSLEIQKKNHILWILQFCAVRALCIEAKYENIPGTRVQAAAGQTSCESLFSKSCFRALCHALVWHVWVVSGKKGFRLCFQAVDTSASSYRLTFTVDLTAWRALAARTGNASIPATSLVPGRGDGSQSHFRSLCQVQKCPGGIWRSWSSWLALHWPLMLVSSLDGWNCITYLPHKAVAEVSKDKEPIGRGCVEFKWFESELMSDSSELRVKWFGCQSIWDSNDLVVNRCVIRMIWLSVDLRFKWVGCQLIWDSSDLFGCQSIWDSKLFCETSFKIGIVKLKNKAFLRDFLKNFNWSSKTKLLYETSFKIEILKLKNEAFLRDFLQKWSFEAQKRSFSARLPSKMTCRPDAWLQNSNTF